MSICPQTRADLLPMSAMAGKGLRLSPRWLRVGKGRTHVWWKAGVFYGQREGAKILCRLMVKEEPAVSRAHRPLLPPPLHPGGHLYRKDQTVAEAGHFILCEGSLEGDKDRHILRSRLEAGERVGLHTCTQLEDLTLARLPAKATQRALLSTLNHLPPVCPLHSITSGQTGLCRA